MVGLSKKSSEAKKADGKSKSHVFERWRAVCATATLEFSWENDCSWLLPGFHLLTFSLSILAGFGQREATHGRGNVVHTLYLCSSPFHPPS